MWGLYSARLRVSSCGTRAIRAPKWPWWSPRWHDPHDGRPGRGRGRELDSRHPPPPVLRSWPRPVIPRHQPGRPLLPNVGVGHELVAIAIRSNGLASPSRPRPRPLVTPRGPTRRPAPTPCSSSEYLHIHTHTPPPRNQGNRGCQQRSEVGWDEDERQRLEIDGEAPQEAPPRAQTLPTQKITKNIDAGPGGTDGRLVDVAKDPHKAGYVCYSAGFTQDAGKGLAEPEIQR